MHCRELFARGKSKVRIKRIVKRKDNIVVETDTAELMQKLEESVLEIGRKFSLKEIIRARPKLIVYDVSTSIPQEQVTPTLFRENEVDMEWAQLHKECAQSFR